MILPSSLTRTGCVRKLIELGHERAYRGERLELGMRVDQPALDPGLPPLPHSFPAGSKVCYFSVHISLKFSHFMVVFKP